MSRMTRSKLRSYIVAIAGLTVLLAGLLALLYLFSKPPTSVGAKGPEGYSFLFTIYGFEGDRLQRPTEVDVDKNGNIYVADSNKHRILVFDSQGNFIRKFGDNQKGALELKFPSDIVVAPDGRVFALSARENKIIIYKNFKPTWVINIPRPSAATISKDRLYVATPRGVMVGDLNGKLITSFGTRGPNTGQMDTPNGIVVDKDGRVYVTDSLNYRIQAFDKTGKSLWTLGKPPKDRKNALRSTERTYGLPTGLAIDDDGYLYFMDAFNGTIVIADKDGKEVRQVGDWGHDDGQFYYPGGIAYAGNETFVIADKFNDRVQVVYVPSPAGSPLAAARNIAIPLALLFLLGLILWLLRRKKNILVIEAQFLDWALENEAIEAIYNSFGKLQVADEVFELYKDRKVGEKTLEEFIDIGKYKEEQVDKLAEEHNITDRATAKALAICKKRGVRPALLSDDELLTKLAEELEVTTFDHDELLELNPQLLEEGIEPELDKTPVV